VPEPHTHSIKLLCLQQPDIARFAHAAPRQVSAGSNESRGGFWRLLVVREGRDETFLPLPPASPGDAGAGGGAGDVTMTSQGDDAAGGGRLLRGCEMRALPLERWAVPVVAQGEAAPEVSVVGTLRSAVGVRGNDSSNLAGGCQGFKGTRGM
jgi:hypothetical protein